MYGVVLWSTLLSPSTRVQSAISGPRTGDPQPPLIAAWDYAPSRVQSIVPNRYYTMYGVPTQLFLSPDNAFLQRTRSILSHHAPSPDWCFRNPTLRRHTWDWIALYYVLIQNFFPLPGLASSSYLLFTFVFFFGVQGLGLFDVKHASHPTCSSAHYACAPLQERGPARALLCYPGDVLYIRAGWRACGRTATRRVFEIWLAWGTHCRRGHRVGSGLRDGEG